MSTTNNLESMILQERLILALEGLGVKKWGRVKKVAEKTGYSEGQVSAILSGREAVNGRFKKAVCGAYLISEEWLETGEGEMLLPSTVSEPISQTVLAEPRTDHGPDDPVLEEGIRLMKKMSRPQLLRFIADLIDKAKDE